ncbi:hypothetical protein LINPERPRIM_LOCUS40509, partial [Linum perenne]
ILSSSLRWSRGGVRKRTRSICTTVRRQSHLRTCTFSPV